MKIFAEELRQFIYCPRIPFLRHNFGTRTSTYSMKKGETYHQVKTKRKYQLKDCQTHYQHYVESITLDIAAVPDLILVYDDHVIVIEHKRFLLGKPHFSVISQAIVGGLCAEEQFGLPLKEVRIVGFNGITYKIIVSSQLRDEVVSAIRELRNSLVENTPPNPIKNKKKCHACEYQNICWTI